MKRLIFKGLSSLIAAVFLVIPTHIERADLEKPVEYVAKTIPVADNKTKEKAKPRTKNVWITAYSSTPEETDDTPFITASGKKVRPGIIAANFLPFGTKVQIPEVFGEKIFEVEDRMHKRKGDQFIDIWMPSKEEAQEFGIMYAKIIILD